MGRQYRRTATAQWTWKGVRQFVEEHFYCIFSSRTWLKYLYRLEFVLKRPKKRLSEANAEKRAAFRLVVLALRSVS